MISATKLANKTKEERKIQNVLLQKAKQKSMSLKCIWFRGFTKKIAQPKTHPKENSLSARQKRQERLQLKRTSLHGFGFLVESEFHCHTVCHTITRLLSDRRYFLLLSNKFIVNRFDSHRCEVPYWNTHREHKRLDKNRRSISTKIGRAEHRGFLNEQFICD